MSATTSERELIKAIAERSVENAPIEDRMRHDTEDFEALMPPTDLAKRVLFVRNQGFTPLRLKIFSDEHLDQHRQHLGIPRHCFQVRP